MVDGLILHLKASRNELTRNEIKAAEDFAIFQTNMERENAHLRRKISQLQKVVLDLTSQIDVSNRQLIRRRKLLKEAESELAEFRKLCAAKTAFYRRETARRQGELEVLRDATDLFNSILRTSSRVRGRASSLASGRGLHSGLGRHVVRASSRVHQSVRAAVSSRAALAFTETEKTEA
jgi:hypothetical protein